jgi:DNA-binding transcriptional LysR family regulator
MNYKHLRYFWVVAKAGGVMRASEQLHTTPQTLSGQIKLLEEWLGHKLFKKNGRRLELTEEGRVALSYADEIFTLGAELEGSVRHARAGLASLDFRVGVADSVAKSVAYHLLEPALGVSEAVRLICHEGKFEDLLAQLALHRLDLVIADERMSRNISVKAFNHALGSSNMTFFCAPGLKATLQGDFPVCLNDAPMLIQATVRPLAVGSRPSAAHRGGVRRQRPDERLWPRRAGRLHVPQRPGSRNSGPVRGRGRGALRRTDRRILRHLGRTADHPSLRGGDHQGGKGPASARRGQARSMSRLDY